MSEFLMINNAVIVHLSSIMTVRRKTLSSGVEITMNSGDVLIVSPPNVDITQVDNPIWDHVVEQLDLTGEAL